MIEKKRCTKCGEVKPLTDFHKDPRGFRTGREGSCKQCKAAYGRAHRKPHTKATRAKNLVAGKKYNDQLRNDVLAAYGGKCACCGESHPEFLAIDHINGGGEKHRRTVGYGHGVYLWLRKHNFPKDKFRLLCHNCNFATSRYKHCPHEKDGQSSVSPDGIGFKGHATPLSLCPAPEGDYSLQKETA